MKILDRAVVLTGLFVLTLLGAALTRTPPAQSATSSAAPGDHAAVQQRVLREGVLGQVRTLDPLFATTQAERDIDALLFRGLTRLGPGGEIVPDLATSWQITDSGRLYTFFLRDDAFWHDGVPVTSDDVVFTVRTLQHPDYIGAAGSAWRGITAERVDKLTVRFRLPAAPGGFLLLAGQSLVPSHVLSGTPIQDLSTSGFGQQPVGTGPFRLESLGPAGAELVAATPVRAAGSGESNPLAGGKAAPSAGPGAQVPGIERYRYRFFADAPSLAAAFRAHEIDAAGGLTVDTAGGLLSDPSARVVGYPRTVLTSVMLNLRPQQITAFRDARVRRALLMLIDRARILDEVLQGRGTLAETPISPASFAYDAKAAGSVPHDVAQAGKLLQAAGWKKGSGGWIGRGAKTPIKFELAALDPAANPIDYAVAQRVAADWNAAGIGAQLQSFTSEELINTKLLPGKYRSAVVDVNLGLDPDLYPLLGSAQALAGGTNLSGYQSRQLDALLKAARAYAAPPVRKQRFAALQRMLAAELPILPLFFSDYLFVVRSTLTGPTSREIAGPQERYWDVLTWRLAEGPSG